MAPRWALFCLSIAMFNNAYLCLLHLQSVYLTNTNRISFPSSSSPSQSSIQSDPIPPSLPSLPLHIISFPHSNVSNPIAQSRPPDAAGSTRCAALCPFAATSFPPHTHWPELLPPPPRSPEAVPPRAVWCSPSRPRSTRGCSTWVTEQSGTCSITRFRRRASLSLKGGNNANWKREFSWITEYMGSGHWISWCCVNRRMKLLCITFEKETPTGRLRCISRNGCIYPRWFVREVAVLHRKAWGCTEYTSFWLQTAPMSHLLRTAINWECAHSRSTTKGNRSHGGVGWYIIECMTRSEPIEELVGKVPHGLLPSKPSHWPSEW